jgi:trans-aconitate 2-methyltransferase
MRRIVDIGCGPGNSTELLARRWPDAEVSGMDSSPEMVAAARERLPGLRFEVADASQWRADGPAPDLLFSNAVFQWVPDHAKLLPGLIRQLAPGGALAVQMPDNLREPAHVLMQEVAAQGPWAARLANVQREERPSAEWYFRVLRDAGATVDIWRTTYHHQLAGGAGAVVEWFKGTGLRPFLKPLSQEEQADYLARYQQALAGAYPVMEDGTVLLPFPRLFFVARRP